MKFRASAPPTGFADAVLMKRMKPAPEPAPRLKLAVGPRRDLDWHHRLIGRDALVAGRATNNALALTTLVTGLLTELNELKQKRENGHKLLHRASRAEDELRKAIDSGSVSQAEAPAVAKLMEAVSGLARALSAYVQDGLVPGAATAALENNLRVLRPLELVTNNLAAETSGAAAIEAQVRQVADGVLDEGWIGAIVALIRDLEAKHVHLNRHDVIDGLDRLLGRHFSKLGRPDGAVAIANTHRELLAKSASITIARALAGAPVPRLTVAEVLVEVLRLGSDRARWDSALFLQLIGVAWVEGVPAADAK